MSEKWIYLGIAYGVMAMAANRLYSWIEPFDFDDWFGRLAITAACPITLPIMLVAFIRECIWQRTWRPR